MKVIFIIIILTNINLKLKCQELNFAGILDSIEQVSPDLLNNSKSFDLFKNKINKDDYPIKYWKCYFNISRLLFNSLKTRTLFGKDSSLLLICKLSDNNQPYKYFNFKYDYNNFYLVLLEDNLEIFYLMTISRDSKIVDFIQIAGKYATVFYVLEGKNKKVLDNVDVCKSQITSDFKINQLMIHNSDTLSNKIFRLNKNGQFIIIKK